MTSWKHQTADAFVAALHHARCPAELPTIEKRLGPGDDAIGIRMRDLFDTAKAATRRGCSMTRDQVVSGATGTWNLDAVPATEDVVLRIACLAKPVVAALALHLDEDGVLDLDAPVERWLPELADRRGLRRLDGCVDDVVTADQAFLVLVRASQDTNRKLHEVAQYRTDTGVLAEGQRGAANARLPR